MIKIKDGGTSSYKLLHALAPKYGDTFISKDGCVLVIILRSAYIVWCRTDTPLEGLFQSGVISDMNEHHFKRVDIDLTVKAV